MPRVLLVNNTEVTLKYFALNHRQKKSIAPEMYNTLYPGGKSIFFVFNKLLLRWKDAAGKDYIEVIDYRSDENEKTIVLEVDPKTLLFEIEEYGGIDVEEKERLMNKERERLRSELFIRDPGDIESYI